MTDEELKTIEDDFNASTQGDWQLILGRPGQKQIFYHLKDPTNPKSELVPREMGIDPRWDIFCGEPLDEIEASVSPHPITNLPQAIAKKDRRQICHFHKETPVIYDKAFNYYGDSKFIVTAHRFVPKMIEEIKRLKNERLPIT